VVVRFIGPGTMFGTVAMFTDGCYPADATPIADRLEASWSAAGLMNPMTATRTGQDRGHLASRSTSPSLAP
jgi:hypothetical protein